jgi:hypothetical protein
MEIEMTNLEWLKGVIATTNFGWIEWMKNLPEEELIRELYAVYNKEWLNAEHVSKIKPCPVCHGKMDIRWQHDACYLVCEDCGMHFGIDTDKAEQGIIEGDYAEEVALIDDWNRRVDDEHE